MGKSYLVNWRPFQFQALEQDILLAKHSLHESGIFDDDNLIRMLDTHPLNDLGVNTMGERPSRFEWREGDRNGVPSDVLLDLVKHGRLWLNLRNVIKHHPAVRDAINNIYDELEAKSPGFRAENRSANLLLSSPGAMVHYHLDVPVNMLWHIRGVKRVWVYPPFDSRFVAQEHIEGIFCGDFAEDLPYDESFDEHAQVFDVQPGELLTWPQNTPHRVTNHDGMCVSLSTEHTNARATRRVNVVQANELLRRRYGLKGLSMEIDGPVAHLKQALTRAVRKYNKIRGVQPKKGYQYPVTFKVDPSAPYGFRLLDESESELPAEAVAV